ncbi:hypothetical protein [Bacillus sp. SD088]|uniref:hypothetical protein n=1 Tax=Bacillus sp. SD088 TaxID=2782012 RepID=UPI001A9627CA|nr:hypothetical protein [Bacillus sp. SD088]MBO0992463.1 hypothetical protein [Bacillus sp. SD088]
MESMEIHMLPCHASSNIADMELITNIVNRVYGGAEAYWLSDDSYRKFCCFVSEVSTDASDSLQVSHFSQGTKKTKQKP